MIRFWSNVFVIYHSIIANCRADVFQFKSIIPKLYPFVPSYSATDDLNAYTHPVGLGAVDPYELAWVVIVFHYKQNRRDIDFVPLCLGILITTIDVLTTCSCVTGDSGIRSNIVVNPKTIIVNFPRWNNELKAVTHVHTHESCRNCNNTSYNDLALLTVQIFQIIYRVIEPLTQKYFETFDDYKHKTNKTLNRRLFRDCFILVMDSKDDENDLNALSLEKRHFTIWDVPSPENEVGTKIVVGQSEKVFNDSAYKRYPGSPLVCRDQSNEQKPVGIYVGLFCDVKVTAADLKKACARKLYGCGDCFPPNLTYALQPEQELCASSHVFEIALMFSNLENWIIDDTFEMLPDVFVPFQKPSSAFSNTCKWNVLTTVFWMFFLNTQF